MSVKVSIVIPVYNGANYLSEAIESALAQTYENIEIIVVNDGSNDEGATEKIALSYGNKIRYIAKENGGSSSALNTGIRNMTGDWFSWLSHDDLYMPKKIEESVNRINDEISGRQIIICGGELMDEQGKKIFHSKKILDGEFNSTQMFEKMSVDFQIGGCSVLIPRNIFDESGVFDENFVYVNDTDFWYRLMLNDYVFTCFTEHLVKTRIHSGQVSVKKAELFNKERKLMEKNILKKLLEKGDSEIKKVKFFMRYTLMHGDIEVANATIRDLRLKGIRCNWYYKYLLVYAYGRILSLAKKCYKRLFFRR